MRAHTHACTHGHITCGYGTNRLYLHLEAPPTTPCLIQSEVRLGNENVWYNEMYSGTALGMGCRLKCVASIIPYHHLPLPQPFPHIPHAVLAPP